MYSKFFALNLLKNVNLRTTSQNLVHTTTKDLAGHSKWQNIRHIKALKDGQRADLFTKFSRQIRLAIVEGGGSTDIKINNQLCNIVEHAMRQNMPKAAINRILTQYDKKDPKTQIKQGLIELKMTHKNVFVLLSLVTDNLAKTKADVNSIVKKSHIVGFAMCRHMFTEKGIITTKLMETSSMDDAMEHAIEVGADDVQLLDRHDTYIQFITDPFHLDRIKTCLDTKGYDIDSYEKIFTPHVTAGITEEEKELYEKFKSKVLNVAGVDDIHDNIEYLEEKVVQKKLEETEDD